MNAPTSPRHRTVTPVLSVAAVVAAGWVLVGLDGRHPGLGTELLAMAPFDPIDLDGDGVPALQEFVLGTSEFLDDTDSDGFLDCEELACGSDPLEPGSVPAALASGELRVGMSARGERDWLRIHIALLSETGQFNTSVLRVGALMGGQVVSVPIDRLLPFAELRDIDLPGTARVRTIDLELDPGIVQATGASTLFIAVGTQGSATYSSAAKVDLYSVDDTLLLRREPVLNSGTPTPAPGQGNQQPTGGGSLRQPIPVAGAQGIPQTWQAGQICYQRSQVTGIVGAKVVHEIVSSSCVTGWDTYCPADCSQSIGSTYETIDPATLIGG